MPLWGTRDFVSGNNKPVWANTANVYGANVTEVTAATWSGKGVSPGWVQVTRGRGAIINVTIANAGSNIRSSGSVNLFYGNAQTNASITYGINNVSNTVNTVTLVTGGDGYLNMPVANVTKPPGAGYDATFTITIGGRFNRNTTETLVVVKNLLSDDGRAFP